MVLQRQALRTFRLDRIAAVEVTSIDVAPREVQLKDLSTGWFEALKDAPLVTLELRTLRGLDSGVLPDRGSHDSLPGGGLIVSLHVTDPAWLRSLLLRLQGGARVLSPDGAGDSAAEAAREALDQYAVLLGTTAGAVSDPGRLRLTVLRRPPPYDRFMGYSVRLARRLRTCPSRTGPRLMSVGPPETTVGLGAACAVDPSDSSRRRPSAIPG